MITLEELIKHRDCLDGITRGDRTTVEEAESVQVALNMLNALITQLESQSVALTF
tara:strand:- start:350 stop:514 length:165 start_codon:yes stop_codon:yes gene_type:complete